MSRLLILVAVVAVAASCTVPEVDLDLPDRSIPLETTRPSEALENQPIGPGNGTAVDPTDPSDAPAGVPDDAELDDLEQLVSEIEALLEGVSDELDQITFEEEGG